MKATISALVDGEQDAGETGIALAALGSDGEAREAWSTYHLIGDAMRDSDSLSPDFASRVAGRIAQEPVVLAPAAQPAPKRSRWFALSAAAASVAAIALVATVAVDPRQAQPPVAQAPRAAPAAKAALARVPPPAGADDYLLAHQRYSPRNSLQGVVPYVRTVSAEAGARKP
ncbi:MAG: anti-sigma 24 factor [Betaproteobacteria bacterium]|nr:MAG: anti-sigma 24 factor [Betaproteobacteria bacterium]